VEGQAAVRVVAGFSGWRAVGSRRRLVGLRRWRFRQCGNAGDSIVPVRKEDAMSMSPRLAEYLEQRSARYEVCAHDQSHTSAQTARLAHVPGHQLAKSVILEDDTGCVMAVVPADARVRIGDVARMLGRHDLHLADERRIAELFKDCAVGAVPPLGMAWGVETVVDDDLGSNAEIYIEAGDHETLVRMTGDQFNALMKDVRHGHFCRPTVQ
jgi:Ala-tRNA(Pro) deacylase